MSIAREGVTALGRLRKSETDASDPRRLLLLAPLLAGERVTAISDTAVPAVGELQGSGVFDSGVLLSAQHGYLGRFPAAEVSPEGVSRTTADSVNNDSAWVRPRCDFLS
jgi:hypothetical protein